MDAYEARLRELAAELRIRPVYRNALGERVEISQEVLRSVIGAIPVQCATLRQVNDSLQTLRSEHWQDFVDPVWSCSPGAELRIQLRLPPAFTAFRCEHFCDGELQGVISGELKILAVEAESVHVDGESYRIYSFRPEPIQRWGFHDLHWTFSSSDGGEEQRKIRIIVGPDAFWQPPGAERFVGAATLTSSLRSRRPGHWGRGNNGDAALAGAELGRMGADFFAGGPRFMFDWPGDLPTATPFMPISQRLLAHQLIDAASAMQRLKLAGCLQQFAAPAIQALIARLRSSKLIQVNEYNGLVFKALRAMWSEFTQTHREQDGVLFEEFRRYVEDRTPQLGKAALFIALRDHFFPPGSMNSQWNWRNWPAEYQQHDSAAVRHFAEEHHDAIDFVMFTQWLAEHDEAFLAESCTQGGMKLGLMANMPIGLSAAAAETWYEREVYFEQIVNGVPGDPLDWRGQSWAYPMWNPRALLRRLLQPFIDNIVCATRHAGLLEIDHGMCLEQRWGYPAGLTATSGAYIGFPFEHMVRTLALLSHRGRFAVVPELVGTKSEMIDADMARAGSYSIVQQRYELRTDGSYKRPEEYPAQAMIVGGTHNQFPEVLWLLGYDIVLSQRFRGDSAEQAARAKEQRSREVAAFLHMLQERQLLQPDEVEALKALSQTPPEDESQLRFLADEPLLRRFALAAQKSRGQTPCRLLTVDIAEALLGAVLNMPGVSEGYPNWLVKLEQAIEDWKHGFLEDVFDAVKT